MASVPGISSAGGPRPILSMACRWRPTCLHAISRPSDPINAGEPTSRICGPAFSSTRIGKHLYCRFADYQGRQGVVRLSAPEHRVLGARSQFGLKILATDGLQGLFHADMDAIDGTRSRSNGWGGRVGACLQARAAACRRPVRGPQASRCADAPEGLVCPAEFPNFWL